MEKNVAVKIKINTETKNLASLNQTLVQTQEHTEIANKGFQKIKQQLDSYAHPLQSISLWWKGIDKTIGFLTEPIKESIRLNSVLEQQKLSLASLVTLNHQNVDSLGHSIDATTKWSLSMQEANEVIKDMTRIHQSSIYAVADLTEMFKSFYSTASASMGLNEAKKVFEGIVYAAQVSGASVDSLKTTLDSLGSGVAQTVTTFGRFVAAQGLSTEAMSKAKKEGNLYNLMLEKLGVFSSLASKSALTYEAALSSLHTGVDALKQAALAPYFQSITEGIKKIGDYLNHHTQELATYIQATIEVSKHIALFASTFLLAKPAIASVNAMLALSKASIALFSNGIDVANISIKAFTLSLRGLKIMLSSFGVPAVLFAISEVFLNWKNSTQDTLNNIQKIDDKTLDSKIQVAKKNYLEQKRKYEQRDYSFSERFFTAGESPFVSAQKEYQRLLNEKRRRENELKVPTLNKLISNPKAIAQDINALNSLKSAYLELSQIGLNEYQKESLAIALKTQGWIDSGMKLNDALKAQSILVDELDSKYQSLSLKNYFENKYAIESKNIEAMDEGLNKNIALENLRFEQTINNLNLEINKKLKNQEISIAGAKELYSVETKLHDKKIKDLKEVAIKTNAFYSDWTSNLNSALNEQFFNALSGRFRDMSSWINDLGTSLSTALTQAFSRSLVGAMIDSSIGEAFSKMIAGSFDKVFGDGELFEKYGQDFGKSAGDKLGMALAGAIIGIAASGIFSSLFADKSNPQAKKDMQIGGIIGAGLGAGIGTFVPVLGPVLGGIIGGIGGSLLSGFKTYTEKTSKQSIELFGTATKDVIKASERTDWHEVKKNGFGMELGTKDWVEYQQANTQALRAVRDNLRTFGYLLQDITGSTKELSIQAGIYADYASLNNEGIKEFISTFVDDKSKRHYTGEWGLYIFDGYSHSLDDFLKDLANQYKLDEDALQKVKTSAKVTYSAKTEGFYKIWSDYAASNSKDTALAIKETLGKYISSGEKFQSWLFGFKGDDIATLAYQKQLSDKNIQRIEESLGIGGINIDNYLQYREKAIKKSFDPNTINTINDLGEALKNGAEASKKYEEALKNESKTKLKMIDPYLKKTRMLNELSEENTNTSEKLGLETLKTLKNLLSSFQEMANTLSLQQPVFKTQGVV
ncbi:hypothetical protein [Helicobacter sp. 13S00477-4]|uniref:hypothetical protein n=1 Tax=Helicobacter sp. 13S00477-4 TaxID=1905759 RepID=UPI000BA5ED00|nr:hypothetical protein [Helicobacter sp. 13S00477-4]PAF51279.1 hypothetical protein BKH44_06120 [Helicobacter sp. 13S00477-4]